MSATAGGTQDAQAQVIAQSSSALSPRFRIVARIDEGVFVDLCASAMGRQWVRTGGGVPRPTPITSSASGAAAGRLLEDLARSLPPPRWQRAAPLERRSPPSSSRPPGRPAVGPPPPRGPTAHGGDRSAVDAATSRPNGTNTISEAPVTLHKVLGLEARLRILRGYPRAGSNPASGTSSLSPLPLPLSCAPAGSRRGGRGGLDATRRPPPSPLQRWSCRREPTLDKGAAQTHTNGE